MWLIRGRFGVMRPTPDFPGSFFGGGWASAFGIAGFLGLPAALFACAVLLKAWKERNSVGP